MQHKAAIWHISHHITIKKNLTVIISNVLNASDKMPLTLKCPQYSVQIRPCYWFICTVFQRGRKKCEFNSTLIRALRQRRAFLDLAQRQFVVHSSLSHLPCHPPSHSTASLRMPRPAHYTPSMISAVPRRRQTRHRGEKNKKQVNGKTSKFMHWLTSVGDTVNLLRAVQAGLLECSQVLSDLWGEHCFCCMWHEDYVVSAGRSQYPVAEQRIIS